MKHFYYVVIIVIMVLFSLFSCSSNSNDQKTNPRNNVRRHNVKTEAPKEATTEGANENFYVYEAKNRRDPFKPILKLESKVDVNKIKLVGFFEDNSKKIIKAIVEDESGNSFYLSEGDFLGTAKVVSVDLKSKKVIFETQKDYYTEQKILTLED